MVFLEVFRLTEWSFQLPMNSMSLSSREHKCNIYERVLQYHYLIITIRDPAQGYYIPPVKLIQRLNDSASEINKKIMLASRLPVH